MSNINTLEKDKFTTDGDGDVCVRVCGDIIVSNVLVNEAFDYIAATYPSATTEVYTYKTGGSGGTTVATVTVVYSDSTKEVILNVART